MGRVKVYSSIHHVVFGLGRVLYSCIHPVEYGSGKGKGFRLSG